MLSRRAICLWLLAVSVCLGLAVSAAVLGQQPAADTAPAEELEEPAEGGAGGGGFGGGAVTEGAAESTGRPSRSRRIGAGSGRYVGAAIAGGGSDTAGPTKATQYSRGSGYSSRGTYDAYSGRPTNGPTGFPGEDSPYFVYNYGTKRRRPDPEMEKLLEQDAKMEQQAQVFAKQFREAEDQPQRAKVRGNVEVLTKEHFDLRQKRRELELSRLEAQLERVRASIKKRSEVKDLIIQRRIARLLGEEDDLAF